tara:strand:+ start:843 stop:3479 length:2637 start_codon:yes stop_codon:yes gene_type:complete
MKTNGKIRNLVGVSALALAAGLALPALAQAQDATATQDPQATEVDEVVVTGIRASLRDSIAVKRRSALVIEAISSEDIGQLPNVTIAEELIRLPGINGTRDRGNQSQAAIRGLGPRLVLGLVNDREVASSEPDRNVRWEIYPSEVVSGVEVYKSQSADLIAGGVAGTINIRTVRPLDYTGARVAASAGAIYYESGKDLPDYDPLGYRASASFTEHLSDTLGVNLGISRQEQHNGFASFQGWGFNDEETGGQPGDVDGDSDLDATPWGAQTEVKRLVEDRTGVNGALQWRPSSNFELNFDALYSKIGIDEDQNQAWYGRNGAIGNWAGGSGWAYSDPGASYTIIDNTVVAATLPFVSVTNVIAHYVEDKTLFVTGVNGRWSMGDWTLTGDLSYSKAERDNTWQAVFTEVYPNWLSFDMRAGVTPSVYTTSDPADPTIQTLPSWVPGQTDRGHLEDELMAARFDAEHWLGDTGLTKVSFGGRISERSKGYRMTQWYQDPIIAALPANLLSSFSVTDFIAPALLNGDFEALAEAAYGRFAEPANAEVLGSRWDVDEQVVEAYVKADFASQWGSTPLTGNVGVRVVSTSTTSDGFESVNGGALTPVSIDNDYVEVLPSLNLTFELAQNKLLRFGAARTVARPPLDELRAGRTLWNSAPPPTGSAGNPLLEPFRATQFDLSYEWYFAPEALFAAAVYYKDVDSHIGYSTQPVDIGGVTYNVTGPFNGDGGGISGAELTFQTPFSFIPGLENFGIYTNFAYVNSDVKEFYPAANPLESTGLAKETATVDLWYSNGRFESRLGYKYHSPFTIIAGWDGSALRTLESEAILDFSASYQVTDQVGVRFQASNLTDEPVRIHYDNSADRLARYDQYGRRFSVDITLRY